MSQNNLQSYYQWQEKNEDIAKWYQVAHEVADKLDEDVINRDSSGEKPLREIQLLKDSGLITLLGPKKWGRC